MPDSLPTSIRSSEVGTEAGGVSECTGSLSQSSGAAESKTMMEQRLEETSTELIPVSDEKMVDIGAVRSIDSIGVHHRCSVGGLSWWGSLADFLRYPYKAIESLFVDYATSPRKAKHILNHLAAYIRGYVGWEAKLITVLGIHADQLLGYKLNILEHRALMVENRSARKAPLPPQFYSPIWGILLYIIHRYELATNVVETGVNEGVSTYHILQALHDNGGGRLHSVELRANTDGIIGGIVPDYLREDWRLLDGCSGTQALPALLGSLEPLDIFVHDSDHCYTNMISEFKLAWPFIKPGGLLIADDIHSNRAYKDFVRERKGEIASAVAIGSVGVVRKVSM